MNNIFKVIIAVLGAINTVFGIFIPIAIALIIVKFYPLIGVFSQNIVIVAGILSSLYKAINIAFLKN